MFRLLRAKSAPASFNITIAHCEGKSLARWPIAVAAGRRGVMARTVSHLPRSRARQGITPCNAGPVLTGPHGRSCRRSSDGEAGGLDPRPPIMLNVPPVQVALSRENIECGIRIQHNRV